METNIETPIKPYNNFSSTMNKLLISLYRLRVMKAGGEQYSPYRVQEAENQVVVEFESLISYYPHIVAGFKDCQVTGDEYKNYLHAYSNSLKRLADSEVVCNVDCSSIKKAIDYYL